ncbi:MAG: DUF4363 family protein [Syntrophomonadaceae bacterium]|nr:DUF4363 family protein [Syntrophomonadaceae bacterium]
MKNKVAAYVLPVVMLALFVLIMNSSNLYIAWGEAPSRVEQQMGAVEDAIEYEQWENAAKGCEELRACWRQALTGLQFSMEKDQAELIEAKLARLSAFIASSDRVHAQAEISELREHWNNLNR